MPICRLSAENYPSAARNLNEDNFYGLCNTIYLCTNAKITLTTNLWTSKGLVNGANGIIRDIIYPLNKFENSLPSVLMIEFDYYIGPRLFSENDHRHNWIPINCFDANYNVLNYSRRQFPIKLAYALTIHKSQGQTITKAVIDLGKKEQTLGLTFVALSRLKKFTDFVIQSMTLERIQKLSQSTMLKPRIEEEKRIKLLEIKTLEYLNQ
jgi:ATP-dependent exoDNAse (exonuclease V) alpha subunit